jgi:hypothetical protein
MHIIEKVWGISSPREFQVEMVDRLVFKPKTCLFLVKKTGGRQVGHCANLGYSLVWQYSCYEVPLLGLGCDQVAKAQRQRFKVEVCHLDKNRGEDQLPIQQRLLSITHRHAQTIILFASPQSLTRG